MMEMKKSKGIISNEQQNILMGIMKKSLQYLLFLEESSSGYRWYSSGQCHNWIIIEFHLVIFLRVTLYEITWLRFVFNKFYCWYWIYGAVKDEKFKFLLIQTFLLTNACILITIIIHILLRFLRNLEILCPCRKAFKYLWPSKGKIACILWSFFVFLIGIF